ncbi:hypothetical protein CBR_g39305 [Chara braunii]|uniref:CCHC-type domain-containing protein n=1 Tax=Chara braunii TaxID=69332 RepID=A0A388K131_CHABU|nr:hypothetical protein CBR_g39305 [Chara braunii]|eukprot:GBG63761.1 hypothetical protein CBR_g39305 [Chara braunii]
MGTPVKCFNCNGDGHFARECPSTKNQNGNGSSASAPTTPRFWTPRRNPEDAEEREFLRQIIQEKREEQARKRELDEQRKFDEKLKLEMARYVEATKAEVMATVGRQYLGQKDEARREELKRGWSPPPRRKEDYRMEEELGDEDEIDLEIRRLELLREKRRRGKEAVRGGVNFRQPSFSAGPGSVDDPAIRGECSRDAAERRRKVPAGTGADGLLQYVLDQKRELSALKIDELKRICAQEDLQLRYERTNDRSDRGGPGKGSLRRFCVLTCDFSAGVASGSSFSV